MSDSSTTEAAEAPADTPPVRYGLKRIVAVNSYATGRIRAISMVGHVHIAGRNGNGKTTLIRLQPLFYGEQPSKMVKANGEGMKPLRDYIFDARSAYLVFEYVNHDGPKLAVMFYGNKDVPSYIFCDGEFDSALFVEQGQFIESSNLNLRLRTFRRNPTAQLGVIQYQQVLQGTARSEKELRPFARRFGLAHTGTLAGIERVASAMFFKDVTFATLKRMAYAVMEDRTSDGLSARIDEKSLRSFFANFRAYQDVMRYGPQFTSLVEQIARFQRASTEQRKVAIRANLLERNYVSAITALDTLIEEQRASLSTRQGAHVEALRAHDDRNHVLKRDCDDAKAIIRRVTKQEAHFAEEKIDEKRTRVANMSRTRAHIDRTKELLGVLESQAGDILREFERLKNAVLLSSGAAIDNIRAQGDGIEATFAARQVALTEQCDADEQVLQRELATEHSARSARRDECADAHNRTQVARAGLNGWSQRYQDKTAELDRELEALEAEVVTLHINATRFVREKSSRRQEYDALEQRMAKGRSSVARLRDEHAHLTQLHGAGESTLLYFLRQQVPGWTETVGKVVRDDVLLNGDLAPELTDTVPNFYGVQVDLSKLPSAVAEREGTLQQKIEALNDQIADEGARAKILETDLRKIGEEVQRLDKECTTNAAAIDIKTERVRELKATIQGIKQEAERDLRNRQAQADEHVNKAQSALRQAREAVAGWEKESEQRRTAFRKRFAREQSELSAWRVHEYAQIKLQEDAEQAARDSQLANLDAALNERLSEGGLDAATRLRVQREHDTYVAELRQAEADLNSVQVYEAWVEMAPPERAQARTHLATLEAQVREAVTARAEDVKTFVREKEFAERQIASVVAEREHIERLLKGLNDFRHQYAIESAGQELGEPFDPIGATGASLAAEYVRAQNERERARDTRNKLARTIHQAFMRAAAGTHVRDFAAEMPAALNDLDGQGVEIQHAAEIFHRWFSEAHEQSRDIITAQCRGACELFLGYHGRLQDFKARMTTLSTQLQHNLDSDMVFAKIQSVSIRISGHVERVRYWSQLCSVVEAFKRWEDDGLGRALPPVLLISQLEALIAAAGGERFEEAPENLIDLEITVNDGTEKRVSNESELKNVSSAGLSQMVLCLIFISFINRVRKDPNVWLTWALDEIGTIDPGNMKALLRMLHKHRIDLVSASPGSTNEAILALFDKHYEILDNFEIQHCLPPQRKVRHV